MLSLFTSSKFRTRVALVLISSCLAVSPTSSVVAAGVGPSWDLNPETNLPYDQMDYPQEPGWQTNPTSIVKWAFWPVCTGVTQDDGTVITGGRSTYCLLAVELQQKGSTTWTKMTPRSNGIAPIAHGWSADWSQPRGSLGLGIRVSPQLRLVNKTLSIDLWDGNNDLDSTYNYRVVANIGILNPVAMRSSGSNGNFEELTVNGTTTLTVSASTGAGSIVIPPTDVCDRELTATRSYSAGWSVTLFDGKLFPKLAPFEGGVVETDAYPSSNSFFPAFNATTGSFSLKVCAPHFKSDGSLNIGYYRLIMSQAMLERAGYVLSLPDGKPVGDGRTRTAAELQSATQKAVNDFQMASSDKQTLAPTVELIVREDGSVDLAIRTEMHYSSPTVSVQRKGPAVWRLTDAPTRGSYLGVRYITKNKISGTLVTELRTASGKVVAKSTKARKSTTRGNADVLVPKKIKPGKYSLRVYMVGPKVKNKQKRTVIQTIPVTIS